MAPLFYRFAGVVILSICLATLGIYASFRYLYGDPLEEIALRQSAAPLFLLEQYIDQAPTDEWLVRLNKVREVSAIGWELIPLEMAARPMSETQRQWLLSGGLVVDVAGRSIFRRVDLNGQRYSDSEHDVIHLQRLPIDIGQVLWQELIRISLIAACLLLPLAWWSRAHWRDLQSLSDVARRFGLGELEARAGVHAQSSLGPLAEQLNRMADRIGHLMVAQRNLLRSVSHELRTPIARMGFGLELLRSADKPEEQERRIGAMEADLSELNALVTELLQLTQLDAPAAPASAEFSVSALLHNCAERAQPQSSPLSIQVRLHEPLGNLVGDARLIARAVNNLLGNAFKYARSQVLLTAQLDTPTTLRFTVEDDGIGIPEASRQQIFEPFFRLDRDQDQAHTGFGLGLAIAAKAIERHGGSITAGASALGGAQMTVRLPQSASTTPG